MNIAAKNPVTGERICSSSVGGYFAPILKFIGYDRIVFMGRSEKLYYVYICENKRSSRILDIFGEKFSMPIMLKYEYV